MKLEKKFFWVIVVCKLRNSCFFLNINVNSKFSYVVIDIIKFKLLIIILYKNFSEEILFLII